MSLKFDIETIPHSHMRYNTAGDYWGEEGVDKVRISDMENSDYEFCVMIHELVELYLCKKRGIKEEDITAFDVKFENDRQDDNFDEPGDHPDAPYRNEHFFATTVERLIAAELGIKWSEYYKAIMDLP